MKNLKNTRCMQYAAAFTAGLSAVVAAMYMSWSSPIIPKIASGESPLGKNVTTGESSWIVSSLMLGVIPGSVFFAWSIEKFGRRGTLLVSGIPLLLPWYIISFANSVWLVCIARPIAGLGMSIAISSVIVYTGEIAEAKIRGTLGVMFNISAIIGELFVYCTGPYVSFLALTLGCGTVPLIFMVSFYFMPESPYYLIKNGKEVEAKTNLRRLLSNDTPDGEIEDQIDTIRSIINTDMKNKTTLWEFITKAEYRQSLIISLAIHTLHQFSGCVAISSYLQTIIARSKSSISPEHSSIICGIIQLPAALITTAIVDKAGRKPLLIVSALGCALALIFEAIYFYLQDIIYADVQFISWIPTAGILFYIVIKPVGVSTLPFVLMGELFPTNIKGQAVAVSLIYNSILGFIVTKIFEPVSKLWGVHVMFSIFALVCILGALFVYFMLPETKGKTFAEIQEKLNKKHKKVYYSLVPKPV